jgi:oligoendopeptidase F
MSAKMIAERKDVPDENKWVLTPLFETDEVWEQLFSDVDKALERYGGYRGHLKDSVRLFKEAIEFHLGLTRRIERLYTYAHLKSDEDKSNQFYLGLHQRALNVHTRASEMASFMTPEIQSMPDEVVNRYLADESLGEYKFYLEKILRYKPHTTPYPQRIRRADSGHEPGARRGTVTGFRSAGQRGFKIWNGNG